MLPPFLFFAPVVFHIMFEDHIPPQQEEVLNVTIFEKLISKFDSNVSQSFSEKNELTILSPILSKAFFHSSCLLSLAASTSFDETNLFSIYLNSCTSSGPCACA